jgi:hypothetical protein
MTHYPVPVSCNPEGGAVSTEALHHFETFINVRIVILTKVKKLSHKCNEGSLDFSEAFSVKMISGMCFCSLK